MFQEFSAGEVFFHGLLLRESQRVPEQQWLRQAVSESADREKNPRRPGRSDAGLTRSWWHITLVAARRKPRMRPFHAAGAKGRGPCGTGRGERAGHREGNSTAS